MATQRTLVIIKPDAVAARHQGAILQMILDAGLTASSMFGNFLLSRSVVEQHYAEHREKPFYANLCDFMMSGPVTVAIVAGEDAVRRMRELVGAIRQQFGTDITRNAIHASDSPESAAREIAIFF